MALIFYLLNYILVLFMLFACPLYSGAWTQPKGKSYAKLTTAYSSATTRIDHANVYRKSDFSTIAGYYYMEYGVFEKSTISLSLPIASTSRSIFVLATDPVEQSSQGLFAGDTELQWRQLAVKKPIVVSGVLGIKAPLAYSEKDKLGTGGFDYDARMLFGASFYPVPLYITGGTGYRLRSGDYKDEINFDVEIGYTLFKTVLTRLVINGIICPSTQEKDMAPKIAPYEQDLYRAGLGIIYIVQKNLEADVSFHRILYGRSVQLTSELFMGIAIKL